MPNEVHILSHTTGRYLNSGGSWSVLRCDARDFLTAVEAKDWCAQKRLVNVEVVVVRDALICMRVPVSEGV